MRKTLLFTMLVGTVLAATAMLLPAPAVSAQSGNACVDRAPVTTRQYFVFGVAADDPDGGLVMRSGPGVQWPQVGVLHPTFGEVWSTGLCQPSSTGSAWFEVWVGNDGPAVWVSSNFLRLAEPACLLETQTSSPALSPHNSGDLLIAGRGYAIRSGTTTAFLGFDSPSNSYQFVAATAVVGSAGICPTDAQVLAPVPSFPPPPSCQGGLCLPPVMTCLPGPCYSPVPYFGPVPPPPSIPPPSFPPQLAPPPFVPWEHGLVVCG